MKRLRDQNVSPISWLNVFATFDFSLIIYMMKSSRVYERSLSEMRWLEALIWSSTARRRATCSSLAMLNLSRLSRLSPMASASNAITVASRVGNDTSPTKYHNWHDWLTVWTQKIVEEWLCSRPIWSNNFYNIDVWDISTDIGKFSINDIS